MNLTVNSLPAKTWNHLKMNRTQVSLEGTFKKHTPEVLAQPAEVLWNASEFDAGVRGDLAPIAGNIAAEYAETSSKMEAPLVLGYHYENEQAASRLVLHAQKDSLLKVVLVLKGRQNLAALQVEALAEENAKIDLYVAELLDRGDTCFFHLAGKCLENADITLTKLDLGAGKLYAGANVDLTGDDSTFHSEVGYHAKPGQLLDMNYVANHQGKRTQSLMEANGTLEEGAKKIFRGTIDFQRGCAGAKGTENENVLLMGEEVVNQTIPLILCKEEDVEGNHGASIGRLDDKVLFYLGSRGIDEATAQQIIAQARIEAICDKFPDEAVREQVREFENIRGISHENEF